MKEELRLVSNFVRIQQNVAEIAYEGRVATSIEFC